MGVLRRTWLTDSVDSMKVYILCVYVQPILDDIINGVSAVLVFLLRYIHKSEIQVTMAAEFLDLNNLS